MRDADESGKPVSAAYRTAAERMDWARDAAIHRTEAAMKPTAGWLAAAKAAAAQSVLEATLSECDAQITRLLEAHAAAGDEDEAKVAELVRSGFLGRLAAPGLHFLEKSGPEAGALAVVAVRHAAEFEASRDRLGGEIAARFRTVIDGHRRRAPGPAGSGEHPKVPLEGRRVLFGFLLVTLVLSLVGVSWLDVLRRVIASF